MKKTILLFLIFIFSPIFAKAATYAVAGCEQQDVQNAINNAQDGDTVLVPAGNCTWTSNIIISNKNITLKGAGQGVTNITDATTAFTGGLDEPAILIDNLNTKHFRITGFTFTGTGGNNGSIMVRGISKSWRIDNCTFDTVSRGIYVYGYTYGVIDHCVFTDPATNFNGILVNEAANGETVEGENSWLRSLSLSTENAVYVEDNKFIFPLDAPVEGNLGVDSGGGARIVVRHNEFTGSNIGIHGADSGGRRSTFSYEIYNNTFTGSKSLSVAIGNVRGGTGVIYDNIMSSVIPVFCKIANYRTAYNENECPLANGETLSWGTCSVYAAKFDRCDGTSKWDGNEDGKMGYPCLDQIGRSTGSIGAQSLEPLYEWGNCKTAFGCTNGDSNDLDFTINMMSNTTNFPIMTDHIKEGRDYYNDTHRPGYTAYTYPHPLTLTCITGDIDCDNQINSQDIQLAINVFLGTETDEDRKNRADLNGDNQANILDIQGVINLILGI